MSDARPPLAMIAALSRNRVIGRDGGLPWRIPEDLKFFKRMTRGHAVIMGRRTFDEVGKPLPERRNIVVSRRTDLRLEGCEVVPTVEDAIARARETDPEPFVIGGAEIYALAMPYATRMYLTWVEREVEGDTWFPPFDEGAWMETERRPGDGVTWVTLERRY